MASFLMLSLFASVFLTATASSQCLSNEKFKRELRLTKMEATLQSLTGKFNDLKAKLNDLEAKNTKLEETNLNIKAELLATRNSFMQCRSWEFKRIDYVFPSLAKVQLNLGHKTVTYTEQIPASLLTQATRAVIISVYCHFHNHDNSNAAMYITFNQKGNENAGTAKLHNYHFNVRANTWYNEMMIPWNTSLGNEAVFKLTYTSIYGTHKQTKKNENWFTVKMVGFINV